jgi:tRNA A37 N6-isopentenylltransferase MiaA
MNMEIIKKYKAVLILVLVVIGSVFFFLYRMYHNDLKALTDFLASYEKFDKAISDFSMGETNNLDSKAGDALIEINSKATHRLSSLIKNDAELMGRALEIADLSGKELESLRAHKRAVQSKNSNLDGLAKEYGDIASKRKAAYARFRELAGLKD